MKRAGPRVLAAAAGALDGLCWLPIGLGPVAPLFALLWFRALRSARDGRQALQVGVWFGVVRYTVAGHFILSLARYSPLAVALFALYVAYIVPFALLESWGAHTLARRTRIGAPFWGTLLFAFLEWTRTLGEVSFPADLVAHDLAPFPEWLAWTRWLGPFSTTLLIFGSGALLDAAWERRRTPRPAAALAAAGIALWLSPWADPSPRPRLLRDVLHVALLQTAVDPMTKLDRSRWPDTWRRLEELTVQAAPGTDLVVWPETARPGAVVWDESEAFGDPQVERISRAAGVPILYGCQIVRMGGRGVRLYNGAALVRPDGTAAQWYGKQRLLPFAEGVPYGAAFGFDPSRRATREGDRSTLRLLGNFSPGPEPTLFVVGPARIGVMICYEGAYPRTARIYRARGANLLAALTDDGWWKDTLFPRWHATMVATRAVETGLPVIRSANGGASTLTDDEGRTRRPSGGSNAAVKRVRVELAGAEPTGYVRFGEVPLAIGAAIASGLALLAVRSASGTSP
ncbi:MAG TPA: apolipoprotein N-acyltransferase [Candidatus Polarisedimenticolaceae bacterium]|nr:apolipoprotein N-acyltransferase [Candidatus Polarisedimenticolaceae bacterium]